MGKLFDWLDSYKNESTMGYDKRINQCSLQLAGYIFFDRCNYDLDRHVFATYIIWNGELNNKFQDPFPQGGYEVHCSNNDADLFCQNNAGIPVYLKIFAKNGRLYAKNIILKWNNKLFMVSFTGCEVSIPDKLCFHGFVSDDLDRETENRIEKFAGDEFWDEKEPLFPQKDPKDDGFPKERSASRKQHFSNGSGNRRPLYLLQGSRQRSSSGPEIGLLRGSYLTGSHGQLSRSGSGFSLTGSGLTGSGFSMMGSGLTGSGFALFGSGFTGSGLSFFHGYFAGSGYSLLGSHRFGSGFRIMFEHEFESEFRLMGSFLSGSGMSLRGSGNVRNGIAGSGIAGSGFRISKAGGFGAGRGSKGCGIGKQIWEKISGDSKECKCIRRKNVVSLNDPFEEEFVPPNREELERELREYAMKEIFGVGFLGYGLNLI